MMTNIISLTMLVTAAFFLNLAIKTLNKKIQKRIALVCAIFLFVNTIVWPSIFSVICCFASITWYGSFSNIEDKNGG
jgi:asparagine N-glycosylation enzyme membrane subunit Stt3